MVRILDINDARELFTRKAVRLAEAEQVVALRSDAGALIAVARGLIASSDLGQHRRDTRALKTERVLSH